MDSDYTKVRVELEIAAQRLISQFMLNNQEIEKQLEAGVKKAFENFDFEKVVELQVKDCIASTIKAAGEWGRIREAVRKKADELIDSYVTKAIENFKKDHNEILNK